jgi:hypothetical protein
VIVSIGRGRSISLCVRPRRAHVSRACDTGFTAWAAAAASAADELSVAGGAGSA